MTEELKPCPHCGAEPTEHAIEPHTHIAQFGEFRMPDHPGSHVIECGCGAGMIDDDRAAVVARWNRRAAPQAAPVRALTDEKPSRDDLLAAVQFYADREHLIWTEESAWDTVSGEPQNWWCDEAGTAMVEDGMLAKMTLEGRMTAQHFADLKAGEEIEDGITAGDTGSGT